MADYIGPYRLLKLIRGGSASHIWEAINPIDNKRIAVKALRSDNAKDAAEVASMKHEFTVGSSLNHPKINSVFEFDVAKGVPYVSMELFKAPNLKQSLREHPDWLTKHMAAIATDGAAALGHMHDAGWVHRDVKPDNFLLSEEGELRLIDFAIAQKLTRKKKGGFGSLFGGKKGLVQGTRSYMAPEQIRNESLDERTDIYGFGCTLFELCVGRPPFTGNSEDELLGKHLKTPTPVIAAHVDEVTSAFSQLVQSMMAKKMDKRPNNMHEIVDQMNKVRVWKRKLKPS